MCVWSDITAVQDYEMRYMNAWLKRWVFNLDLNRESVWTERYQECYSRAYTPLISIFILIQFKSYNLN